MAFIVGGFAIYLTENTINYCSCSEKLGDLIVRCRIVGGFCGFLVLSICLVGCGPELSERDLGTVVDEIPKVAGSEKPYRFHVRPTSLINLTMLREMIIGWKLADAIIVLGSIDICLAEVDR